MKNDVVVFHDASDREKFARKVKRAKSLLPCKINSKRYQINYESGYFVARRYNSKECCIFMAIMNERTFIDRFLNGDKMPEDTVLTGTMLRNDYDILAPNSARCFLYSSNT